MPLKKYHEKRDFKKTTEPFGKEKKSKKPIFVIQKHEARRLHYDFRLEMEGVLKSWAVPKGPSLDPSVKRLAVHVEDHPIDYAKFEGVIPAKQYGAGPVMIWDNGTWINEDNKKKYEDGVLTFLLQGKKLKGEWKLIQIKSDPKNWLLIKVKDKYAKASDDYDILDEDKSVVSKRTLVEIKDKKKINENVDNLLNKTQKVNRLPEFIQPQLATLVDKAPNGNDWLHELKFDGYRLLCFIDKDIRFLTRRNNDWTESFPTLKREIKKLKNLKGTILDGEVVALDEKNRFSFQMLQNALHEDATIPLYYYVFDMLYYQGHELLHLSLLERKNLLEKVLESLDSHFILYSDHIIGQGLEVYKKACSLFLEGIISKNIHSIYVQCRSKNWLKVKCSQRQEFVVGGFTKPRGSREGFGSLLLGYFDEAQHLQYCGHVGTGFNQASLREIWTLLKKHVRESSPFANKLREPHLLSWTEPKIVVEIEFLEWTSDNILRHPSFKGLREDKAACQVKKEEATKVNDSKKTQKQIILSHPDKILYPEEGITKLEVAQYYETVKDWIMPYLAYRPLTLIRCPQGVSKKCFYQRHLKGHNKSKDLFGIEIKDKTNPEQYIYIKNERGLLQLVQMNVLEFHPWGGKVDNIEKPDWMIFDLDPDSDVSWKEVVQSAFLLKEELEYYDILSFVKTTGGKGLHVVVPLRRRYTWENIVHFSKIFVQYLVAKYPDQYIDVMSKAKRRHKIFIDYLRNHRGATAVGPYSTRVKEMVTVATPLSWDELTPKITSDYFTIHNLPQRLERLKKDPWQHFFELKQKLPRLK